MTVIINIPDVKSTLFNTLFENSVSCHKFFNVKLISDHSFSLSSLDVSSKESNLIVANGSGNEDFDLDFYINSKKSWKDSCYEMMYLPFFHYLNQFIEITPIKAAYERIEVFLNTKIRDKDQLELSIDLCFKNGIITVYFEKVIRIEVSISLLFCFTCTVDSDFNILEYQNYALSDEMPEIEQTPLTRDQLIYTIKLLVYKDLMDLSDKEIVGYVSKIFSDDVEDFNRYCTIKEMEYL